jgi:hypothetical protein
MGSNWRTDNLIDMESRDRLIQISRCQGFVDLSFLVSHVEKEADVADDEFLITFPWYIFMASEHDGVSPCSKFIISINALNFLQWFIKQFTLPLFVEVIALNYPFMIMVTFNWNCIRWVIRSILITRGSVLIFLVAFNFFFSASLSLCDIRTYWIWSFLANWLK